MTTCTYCEAPATSVDHVVPRALGGSDDPANLVPACTWCNSSKRDTQLDEWLASTTGERASRSYNYLAYGAIADDDEEAWGIARAAWQNTLHHQLVAAGVEDTVFVTPNGAYRTGQFGTVSAMAKPHVPGYTPTRLDRYWPEPVVATDLINTGPRTTVRELLASRPVTVGHGPSRSGVRAARAGMKSDPGFQIGDSPNLIEFFPSGSAGV
jgi:hypothetical protein